MRYLVAYYTLTGKTEIIAKNIAGDLGASIEHIQTAKPINVGDFRRFGLSNIGLVHSIIVRKKVKINKPSCNVQDFDRTIIATPVWMNNPPPAVNSYIEGQNFRNKEVAVIATTMGGGNAQNTFSVFGSRIAKNCGKVIAMHEIKIDGLSEHDIVGITRQISKSLESL